MPNFSSAKGQTHEEQMKNLEIDFYIQVNQVIAEKITPAYNFFVLISAATFAYFVVLE